MLLNMMSCTAPSCQTAHRHGERSHPVIVTTEQCLRGEEVLQERVDMELRCLHIRLCPFTPSADPLCNVKAIVTAKHSPLIVKAHVWAYLAPSHYLSARDIEQPTWGSGVSTKSPTESGTATIDGWDFTRNVLELVNSCCIKMTAFIVLHRINHTHPPTSGL